MSQSLIVTSVSLTVPPNQACSALFTVLKLLSVTERSTVPASEYNINAVSSDSKREFETVIRKSLSFWNGRSANTAEEPFVNWHWSIDKSTSLAWRRTASLKRENLQPRSVTRGDPSRIWTAAPGIHSSEF